MKNAVIAAVAVVAAVVLAGRCHQGAISEWEDRVNRVQRLAEAERAQARALADVVARQHAENRALAGQLDAQAPEIRERIVRVQAETPDSLRDHPAIVARDSIIEDLREESDGWREAYRREAENVALLLDRVDGTLAVVDSLQNVLDDRPGDRPWWLPRLTVGPSLGRDGIDPVRINLGWEIRP